MTADASKKINSINLGMSTNKEHSIRSKEYSIFVA